MNKMLAYCLIVITALTGVLAGPVGLEPAFTLHVFLPIFISGIELCWVKHETNTT